MERVEWGASRLSRDLGDFPTPPALVAEVLQRLGPIGSQWPRVLEPTCGRGAFLQGLIEADSPPREIRGVELQPSHFEAAQSLLKGWRGGTGQVIQGSVFALDLARDLTWAEEGPLLVVGNPPWVTNSELGSLGSDNLPRKSNVKRLRGIDACTGASNFDIAEAIWLKLIRELAPEEATIALLCKTSVARRILRFASRAPLPIADASLYRLDARRWFRASVDACLFRLQLAPSGAYGAVSARIPWFADLGDAQPAGAIGVKEGKLISNFDAYQAVAHADGQCSLTWRQGLKHDAAPVMELTSDPSGSLRNRSGDLVDVESAWVYPLFKGADLLKFKGGEGELARASRSVVVTQERVGQETARLERAAPLLWAYLTRNASVFHRRKSSIYQGRPPFSIFGVGPYSFAPFKVAISGLGKVPRFEVVGPVGGRPVMFDDTCYFLPCRTAMQAALVGAVLNDPVTLELLGAISFPDAKRPMTKSILSRVDLGAIVRRADHARLLERAEAYLAMISDPSLC